MSEQKEAGGDKPTEAKPKSKNKLIFIGLGVLSLLAGAGVPMFLSGGGVADEAVVGEELEEVKRLENLDLGIFIVNLSETSSFLKTHIIIEYDAALLDKQTIMVEGGEGGGSAHGGGAAGGEAGGGAGVPAYFLKKETILRHTIIRILSSKRVDEMLTQDGKDRLGEELIEGLNEAIALERPPVSQVFFTEFIIQ